MFEGTATLQVDRAPTEAQKAMRGPTTVAKATPRSNVAVTLAEGRPVRPRSPGYQPTEQEGEHKIRKAADMGFMGSPLLTTESGRNEDKTHKPEIKRS